MNHVKRVVLFTGLIITLLLAQAPAFSAGETAATDNKNVTGKGVDSVKIIKKMEDATRANIAEKKDDINKAQKEALKVFDEKAEVEKKSILKEKEAEAVKQELEVIKKEAGTTKDPEALEKVKILSREAKKLEKEADIEMEKLGVVEEKASLA